MNFRRPVLIAGAGPTGLTLANCLSAYEVPFEIIDRKTEPSADSKALAVNMLSQYLLELIGKEGSLGRQGCRVRRINVFWESVRLNAIDFRWLDFPTRSFITQPQAVTERELAAALPADTRVQWNTELVELSQQAGGVHAVLRDAQGNLVRREYEYVVGCEGKTSVSRETIGAKLSGWDYPMHFWLGDFPLAWQRPNDQAYYHVFADTFFVIVPISATHWRVVVKRDGAFDPSRKVSSAEIRALAERYLGPGLFAGDAVWLSGAPFYMRTASSLGRGRVFICGDAAHLFSPIGGTGMNTGMLDAFDLAWRLAYMQRRYAAPEPLLGSYEEERLEAIAQAAAAADGATRLIARLDTAPERVAAMLPSLRRRKLLSGPLPFRQAGFGLEYTRSSVIDRAASAGSPRAGSMCLWVPVLRRELERQGHTRVGALDLLIVAFVPESASLGEKVGLATELEQLKQRYRAPIAAFMVQSNPERCSTCAVPELCLDAKLRRSLGVPDGALLVIRPDAVLCYSGSLESPAAVARSLDRWLSLRRPTSFAQGTIEYTSAILSPAGERHST